MKSCEQFSEKIDCDLATPKECNDTKVAVVKYCSHKECAGEYTLQNGSSTIVQSQSKANTSD